MPRDFARRRYFSSDAARIRAIQGQIADAANPPQAPGHADRQPVEPPVDTRRARRGEQNGRVRAAVKWSTKPKDGR